jgi:hypothetical protein
VGTPEQIAKNAASFTGQHLAPLLERGARTVVKPARVKSNARREIVAVE